MRLRKSNVSTPPFMARLGGVFPTVICLMLISVIAVGDALAQEIPPPAESAPPPLGPLPPPQEQILTPIPQKFDWVRRDARPNPFLASLLELQDVQSRLFMAVTLAEEYTDNFSLDDEEEGEEFRTRLGLSTTYRLERGRGFLSFANTISGNYEARSEDSDIGFANVSLNTGYTLPRLSLALNASFIREDDALQTSSANIRSGRSTFTRSTVTPQIRYTLSRTTSTTLAYTNTVVWNEGEDESNSMSHTVTTGLQHRFSRRLSTNFTYAFTAEDTEDATTSQTYRAGNDLGYALTRHTSLSLQTFGEVIRRSGDGIDVNTYGVTGEVHHRLTTRVGLFVAAGATVTDRAGQSLRIDPNWQVSLDAGLSSHTKLSLATQGSVDNTGGDVDAVGLVLRQSASANVSHTVTRTLSLSLLVSYTHTEFLDDAGTQESDRGRKDDFWSAGTTASYVLTRFWSLSLNYLYQRRDSNRPEEDFDAHRVTLAVTGRFSVL
jgi:hypothetical protein